MNNDNPQPQPPAAHLHPADLRALVRLVAQATTGVTNLVEHVHLGQPLPAAPDRTGGIAPLTYRTIRGVTRLVGDSLDVVLAPLDLLGERRPTPERQAILAALNGALGDQLTESCSTLAVTMAFRRDGETLPEDRAALARAIPAASGKVILLIHGLLMSDSQWAFDGDDFGAALARDLGYTPVYLLYNSGRHISTNGRELAERLEALLAAWPCPVEEVSILGYSMGGLVARSAAHYAAAADHDWLRRLRHLVFLGTPHHGAPLERGGAWVNIALEAVPYAAPFGRIGRGRSAGITDLRHGNLLDEDWQGRDRFRDTIDRRQIVPLPPGVACYTMAGSLRPGPDVLSDRLLGDGLVPLNSALGLHRDPARTLDLPDERRWIGYGLGHLDLLRQPVVYDRLRAWLAE